MGPETLEGIETPCIPSPLSSVFYRCNNTQARSLNRMLSAYRMPRVCMCRVLPATSVHSLRRSSRLSWIPQEFLRGS